MTGLSEEAFALRPLWALTTGAAVGALCSATNAVVPPPWLPPAMLVVGFVATTLALRRWGRERHELWLLAGLALVCGRGLGQTGDALHLARLIADGETTVRARVVIVEGWAEARWGRRTRARVVAATHRSDKLRLPRHCRLEVRGPADTDRLPAPGSEVDILARVRGTPRSPLLVTASGRLLRTSGGRSLLPALRDRLAHRLLSAAGTDASRIRAAEMAAALALGRRDLVSTERRDRWRRSGLAHVLAVSGLHVGLVGGAVWLMVALAGAGPRTTRLAVLAVLPAYAVLAGAAPSAIRATLMAVIYLGARLLGRAILPMAAVLLAVTILLIFQPALIADAGFQLTVVITAALVRWVPVLARGLYGPRWIAGAVAVPIIAQTAAAPILASHFRALMPGAVLANIIALPLLAPTILGSVAATVIASLWEGAAGFLLDLVGALLYLLRLAGAPARAVELMTPQLPLTVVVALVIAGWLALQAGRRARYGGIAWIFVLAVVAVSWHLRRPILAPTVDLLPVSDGAAVLVCDGDDAVMADSGRYQRQSAQLLADSGRRKLRAVIATHTDEDHIGGLRQVLRSFEVGRLIVPAWMLAEPQVVPLLRASRRSGVRVQPVAAGSTVTLGAVRLVVLWPPADHPPRLENERSLVARALMEHGTALLTADIGWPTERRLARTGWLRSTVLVVPHHGGRGSTSPTFLDAVAPSVALIPAASGNTHGHPHREVLARLAERGIPTRYPARDGTCGAQWNGEIWVAFP